MPAIRTFDKGLMPMGAPDSAPPGTMRRNKGLARVLEGTARSRSGCSNLYSHAAHSIQRFDAHRYYIAGTVLYRDGVSILTGLSGNRATWVVGPPTLGKPDYLFLADGTYMYKIATDGTVTNWGIAPPDNATLAAGTGINLALEAFEAHGDWTAVAPTGKSTDTARFTEGTASVRVTHTSIGTIASIYRAHILDLTTSGGVDSPVEDDISLQIYCSEPDDIDYLFIGFALGTAYSATAEANDEYIYVIRFFDSGTARPEGSARYWNRQAQFRGVSYNVAPHGSLTEDNKRNKNNKEIDTFDTARATIIAASAIRASATPNTWWELRIPKDAFTKCGSGAYDWSDVVGIKVGFKISAQAITLPTVNFDDLRLKGGYGLRGRYRGYITAKNSTTGSESNPNADYGEVLDINRVPITWTLPGVHADAQVDKYVRYRTLGDGGLYLKADEHDDATASVTDNVADYPGMHSGINATYLTLDELSFNNIKPSGAYADIVGLYLGRIWACHDTTEGSGDKLYYTRAGYLEAFEGYIRIGTDDDITQRAVIWNRSLYVFTQNGVYQVLGTDQPFIAVKVKDVPGTTLRFSVLATPFGIIYEAEDGIRVFNGTGSSLTVSQPILDIFQGRALDGLPAWLGTTCAIAGEDYAYLSDGTTTLCINSSAQWRNVGIGLDGVAYEADTGYFIGSETIRGVFILEADGIITDALSSGLDGLPIALDWEFPYQRLADNRQFGLLRRVSIEANTGGSQLTPTLIIDGVELELAPFTTATRDVVEYTVARPCRVLGLRLSGSVTTAVELYGYEPDVWFGDSAR